MGIAGLLGSLKSIQRPAHLREFQNKTVAVDAYGWLHRGAVACAVEIATGKPTSKFVDFAMHRVRMLLHFGVTPYLVFDGDHLPSKAITESSRATRRQESKARGMELLRLGKKTQAYQELQRAIDITPQMARMLIDELKRNNVQYVVAPYEADSQMVYLERKGIVDAIVSEDSDLLVFGAACLVTKLDQYGECMVIRRNDFTACREINLTGWNDAQFRCMAILNGCDYLEGIPRMGIKTAHRLVRKYKTIEDVLRGAQWEGKLRIPAGYLESYAQAEKTFLHQWVFCPLQKRLVHFTQPEDPGQIRHAGYIGAFVEDSISRGIATGDLDPMTKQKILLSPAQLNLHHNNPAVRQSTHNTKEQSIGAKNSKTIHSFFKPQRTPLAEIDPNSFRPSASQDQLLQSQNSSAGWAPVPAPTSSVTPQQPPAQMISTLRTPLRTPDVGHQAKRQRLCVDDSISGSDHEQALGLESSPFFSSSKAPPGHGPEATRAKRRHMLQFDLWSDAAIEGDDNSKRTKLKVHNDQHPARNIFSAIEGGNRRRDDVADAGDSGERRYEKVQGNALPSIIDDEPAAPMALTETSFNLTKTPGKKAHGESSCRRAVSHSSSTRQATEHVAVQESPVSRSRLNKLDAPKAQLSLMDFNTGATIQQPIKGSEDALVPESDFGSDVDERLGSSDFSDGPQPVSPVTSPFTPLTEGGRRKGQALDLTKFMYS